MLLSVKENALTNPEKSALITSLNAALERVTGWDYQGYKYTEEREHVRTIYAISELINEIKLGRDFTVVVNTSSASLVFLNWITEVHINCNNNCTACPNSKVCDFIYSLYAEIVRIHSALTLGHTDC